MKTRQLLILLTLGLSLTLILLWLLGSLSTVVLAQGGSGVIRVAPPPTGNDAPNCGGEANPCRTVQYAVDQAQAGDEIRVAAGTYTGVSARAGITQAVYISKTVTVRGGYTTTNWTTSDPENNPTTLDAQGQGRVIYIIGDISPTIEGLRITGGNADGLGGYTWGPTTYDVGGGVYVTTATATIRDNQVFSNTTKDYGGGLFLRLSDTTLSGNIVTSNTATLGGGGLYLEYSDATLGGNTISANTGGKGGGLLLGDSDAALSNNTVSGNTAGDCGGLLLSLSEATFNANAIISNIAEWDGGGLCLVSSDATLINNVVADNQANRTGCGLYIEDSSPRLLHTTVAHNSEGDGSGVYITNVCAKSCFHSTVALINTILVSQTVGITVTAGNTATLESTLWNGNATDWGGAGTINRSNDYTGDPAFVDPEGGNYHIGLASAAIDKGVDAGVDNDMDGESRPQGSGYDIGADETGLAVVKQANPEPAQAGMQLTYTIQVTNTSNVDLHAAITDTLPNHITPTRVLTWAPVAIAPGSSWTQTVIVTVEMDYIGPLVNVVQVTTEEGATGVYTQTSTSGYIIYLPVVLHQHQ